jgi:hypothetical protein
MQSVTYTFNAHFSIIFLSAHGSPNAIKLTFKFQPVRTVEHEYILQ